jgi:DNA-directed RNA polymerase subunit beta'
LKRTDKNLVVARDVVLQQLQYYKVLQSFASNKNHLSLAASFQETTKVLNEAAVAGKIDYLRLKGHRIPAGTNCERIWYKL